MTSPLVERVTALLRARYPDGDIAVTEEPDGITLEVHTGNADHLFASIGDERSAILVALESSSPDVPRRHAASVHVPGIVRNLGIYGSS